MYNIEELIHRNNLEESTCDEYPRSYIDIPKLKFGVVYYDNADVSLQYEVDYRGNVESWLEVEGADDLKVICSIDEWKE